MEFFHEGSPTTAISEQRAGELLDGMLAQLRKKGDLKRVLLIPPDITRMHAWAGFLTCALYERLKDHTEIVILPALGTHAAMTRAEMDRMFPGVPHSLFRVHDWRNGVVPLGEVPAPFVRAISGGKLNFPMNVEIDRIVVEEDWDAIFSIGQLVPHEVIGIANHSKNIFVGVGGSDLINRTHWLGAVHGIERIMGRAQTPVRAVFDYASQHFTKHLPIVYLLTVRARDEAGHLVTRGLYAGDDDACFKRGAQVCRAANLDRLDRAPKKVVVYLDPFEFKSTWLGNKAVYRTRMAIADGGELIVLAPGVKEFGEDPTIDKLIRRYGYRGTPTTLQRVESEPELAANLSAAAHLIHGSSEGRFKITYCPGHLTREEIEGAGFGYGDLAAMSQRYDIRTLRDGWNTMPDGEEVFYVSNPALGLWGTADRFDKQA
ncbi:MAG: lactate racemase domain-containing protein [Gemmataceae bacterium]|nr:lactate racemase domain-containing protein [Gemmataceae bacterium]